MALIFRPAVQADLSAILQLYADTGLDEGITLPRQAAEAIFQGLQAQTRPQLYVAEADGAVVGTFSLLVMNNLGHGGAPCGFVEDVAIDRALRGKGHGRAMMDYAADRCREAGCFKLTLSSHLAREPAHAFYESLGYRKHGFSFYLDLRAPD